MPEVCNGCVEIAGDHETNSNLQLSCEEIDGDEIQRHDEHAIGYGFDNRATDKSVFAHVFGCSYFL